MSSYGLTNTGFKRKTYNDILNDMLAKARATWGDTFATNQSSDDFKDMANRAEELAEMWEQAEKTYFSLFPDTSSGINLTRNSALVGVTKIEAKKSIVRGVELVNGSGSPITIPAGSLVSQSTTGIQWSLINSVTIPASSTGTGDFQCTQDGPIYASINSIDTILDFISGWDSVDNPADVTVGDLGRLEETDMDLKVKREVAIKSPSSAAGDSIANKIITEVPSCIYANYRDNDTDTVDGNGLPPHSIEFFVLGGSNLDIANTIRKYKPAGIKTHGGNTQVVQDSLGNSITIKWSSLVQKDIYFRIDIVTNGDWDGAFEGDIEDIIIDYVNNQHTFNATLYTWRYYTLLQNIIGIDSITIYQGYTSNPNTVANLTPAVNEKPYTTPSYFTFNIT